MRPVEFSETRSKVVSPAKGMVLEVGFGSGYNLPFYKNTKKLYALDPSRELYSFALERIAAVSFPIEYLQDSAENIPLGDNTIDTVVSTWSLCSIPHPQKALGEVKRVLKPGGKFFFVEHGLSPKNINSTVQKMVTPVTRHFTGNCHLDRKMDALINGSGLVIENIEMSSEEGRPLMFSYCGVAVKKAV